MNSLPAKSRLRRFLTFVMTTCLLIGLLQGASISTSQFANAAAGDAGSLRTNSDAGIQFSNQVTALTDAFTIEGWWKWETGASTSGNQLLLGGTGTPGIYTAGNSALRLTRWGGGYDSADCTLPAILTPGSWYHLAIGRSSVGSVTVWFNGIALPNCTNISVSPFISLSTQFPSKFGGNSAGTKFDGYVANYRATSTDIYGAATGNRFTPVASFYPLISGTVNLLNTPNDAATGFSDSVVSGSEFTSHTGGTISADYPTYIEQSICFDGSQVKYLNIDSIGTTDFTLELWVKPTAWSNYMTFLSTKIDANGAYLGYNTNAGDHRILFYENGVGAGDTYVPENQWSHIAVVRSGINMKMYFNGNVVGENTNSTKNFSNPKLYVGSSYEASANNPNNFKGCMSSVRLVKSAVYTSPFTPAAKGSFATLPNATKSIAELTAVNGQVISSGTGGLLQGATGTLAFSSLGLAQSTLIINSATGTYGSTTLLTTVGGSGSGVVSYTVNSGNCSIVGDVLSNSSAGNCVITATKANDENYLSTSSAQSTVAIAKKSEIFSYSISSNTGSFKYGSTYTVSMNFPAGAVSGNGGWNVFKASTAIGINSGGDQMCTGASVTAAGTFTCSFNSAAMWPNAQAQAISGLYVRFNGSTNYNSFNQDSIGTKLTVAGCDYAFCPSAESITVTATNKSIYFGTNLGGTGYETPYGDLGGQLRYTISNGANGATKAWGVSCTSTYSTGAGVGTYPITCSSTTRPSGSPSPVTNDWVVANTNYTSLWDANTENLLYSLNNPRSYTSAADWWKRGSFYTSDTYKHLSFIQGNLTVNPLTLSAPTSVTASAIPNSSTSVKASFTPSTNASSHSALVYLSNGTTLVTTVPNYESGTAIVGLSADTAYKVAIRAIGNASDTINSVNSTQASVSTNMNYNRSITYSAGVGAIGTPPNSQIKLTGETFTVSSGSSFSKDGHSFSNWNSGLSSYSAGSTFTVGSVNETLTAQWTVNAYPIDFHANGGSSGGVVNVNYGSSALPSAPTVTRSDYSLAGWADTTTSSVLTSWTVVSEKTLYAIWSPKVYTISYSPESGTAATASETFTVLTMPSTWQIPTRSNYAFDGWYTDKTWSTLRGTGGSSFTPNETETVYAKWTQSSLVGLTSPTSFGNIIATPGNDGGISATRSGTRVEVDYFADSLPDNTVITAYLQGNTTRAASVLTGVSNLLLSVVVAWKAPDETVPDVNPAKNAIRMKITNADIKSGAKVYSIVNNTSTLLATATQDGFVVIELRVDPEIVIANPVEVPTPPSGGGVVAYTSTASIDDPETLKAAEAKAAEELRIAREKAEAEIKAANDAAEIDAKLRAEEAARIAAKLKAEEDAALAAALVAQNFVPELTLYSITSKLKLSTFDTAYLTEYVSTLKKRATITCIGYVYSKLTSVTKARELATRQATAVCKMIKAKRGTLITRVQLLPASKAPKAAKNSKWVAVSYRVDGYKS